MLNNPDSPFASVIGLGVLKSEYSNTGRGRWISLIFGSLFVLAGPALLLLAAFLGLDAYNTTGPDTILDAVLLPLIFAAISLFIGLVILINTWRNWSLAAALYENGVAYMSRQGLQQVAWSDATAVWQSVTRHYTNGVYTGTTHVYTIQTTLGQKIVLDDRLGKKIEELGNAVQSGVSNMLFPRYWDTLQSGQRLAFGPLALDREKLYAGKKEIRWDEIKAVKIHKGLISIRKDKGWFSWASASVPRIPNFLVFYKLVGRFAKIE